MMNSNNGMKKKAETENKIQFEAALDKTGFGLFNYLHTLLTGLIIISFAFVMYPGTIIVPASACDLGTTAGQQGMLQAAPLIGSIIGSLLWGYLGDTQGRRNMLICSLVLSIVFNLIASISVNWIMLMIFQFITTAMASGKYTLSVTLLSECVPLARRNLVLLLVASIFLLSQGIMAVLAIPIIPLTFSYYLPSLDIYWTSWRTLIVVYSIPSVISILWLLFIPESPKFLLLKGKQEEAMEVLRKIHRINNRSGQEYQVKGLMAEYSEIDAEPKSKKDHVVPLFKAPLLKYTIIMVSLYLLQHVGSFVIWLPTIANQFVGILQTGEGSDIAVCGIIKSAIDAPSDPDVQPCAINATALLMVLGVGAFQSLVNLVLSVVVNKTGRRNMVMFITSFFGLCGILTNLVPNAIASGLFFAVYMLGILTLGLYPAISVALFPTHLRAMAVSMTVASGRIGGFASIQILNYLLLNNCEVGFYVFASMFASSAIVAAFLPDDRLLLKPSSPPQKKEVEESNL